MSGKYNLLSLLMIIAFLATACTNSIIQKPKVIEFKGDIPFDMPPITLPVFPDKTFYITDFGAVLITEIITVGDLEYLKKIKMYFYWMTTIPEVLWYVV